MGWIRSPHERSDMRDISIPDVASLIRAAANNRSSASQHRYDYALTMTYELIKPPFTQSFQEMAKEELNRYLEWFGGVLAERLSELAKAV